MIDSTPGYTTSAPSPSASRDDVAHRYLALHRQLGGSSQQWVSQFVTLLARADAVARGVLTPDGVTWIETLHVNRDESLAGIAQVVEHVTRNGQSLWVEDVSALQPAADELLALGWRALAALPITFQERTIGAVVLGYRNPWVWTAHERHVLESWTQQGQYIREAMRVAADDERRRWRAAEERYRLIFESAPMGVLLADGEGRILMANRALATFFGVDLAHVIGRSVLDFVARLGDAPLPPWIQEWLRGRGGAHAADLVVRQPGGDARTLRLSAIGLSEREHQRPLAIAMVEDVTERCAIEQSLRDHALQLRQAQKMESVGQLAGGLAHDFNNTLAVILGLASLLRADLADGDPRRADAVEIFNITQRASGITRRLLQLSRHQRAQVERVDLCDLLTDFESVARKLLPRSIHLATILPSEPVPVRADRSQIEQVLMNLLINARDAMPQGGAVTVELNIVKQALRGGAAVPCSRITVTDNGTGIGPELIQQIWEPFFTTKGVAGTGLGLPTSRSIVRESGGDLLVASRPGAGATFTVLLPVAADPAELLTSAERSATHQPSRHSGRTILLAEDEDAVRATTRRLLERAGYEVLVARHGGDAWLRFLERESDIALVVTDLVMPELSGTHLVQRIRQRAPSLPVIGLSGYSGEEWREHVDSTAPLHVLQKPFTSEELLGLVSRAFDAAPDTMSKVTRTRSVVVTQAA